jgi:hypothetical protein
LGLGLANEKKFPMLITREASADKENINPANPAKEKNEWTILLKRMCLQKIGNNLAKLHP